MVSFTFQSIVQLYRRQYLPKSHFKEYGFQKKGNNYTYPISTNNSATDTDNNLFFVIKEKH